MEKVRKPKTVFKMFLHTMCLFLFVFMMQEGHNVRCFLLLYKLIIYCIEMTVNAISSRCTVETVFCLTSEKTQEHACLLLIYRECSDDHRFTTPYVSCWMVLDPQIHALQYTLGRSCGYCVQMVLVWGHIVAHCVVEVCASSLQKSEKCKE